ncbi:iron ABC transporter permease [Epilithonimonas ginsengisoli]|uniref:Iron ABC transporter permease n=1 Tax=Epilithonimonas ginsengisoli TaxID=1245592 RepID=A0ABU4JJY7_9FLAO|nr:MULTISPECIES: iron ABC transporter permease [Chryseobacterium group]MBV6881033.1 iron ABC transporter permease [Epilithonimonas sp. FP105]MDW8549982.1 iron ABC transporter permease [Epilithonimonas ginsengisoli]OAH76509.1 ABC transporter permease [Chryseobacterium sp. FP211-J200]
MLKNKFGILCFSIIVGIIISFLINLNVGYAKLNFSDFLNSERENFEIAGFRINRALAMILAGIAIPTSGFLLQEYFKNPLAGPDVLGITSVSSLFVAFYIFFSQDILIPDFIQNSFITLSSILGSVVLMMILLLFSNRFRDRSFIIIFGFLISALAGAVVSFLQFYVESQSLKNYILWTFGANNQANFSQISILTILIIIGLFFTFKSIKPLIGNSLGSAYAQSFGISQSKLKISIIVASSVLSASVTAFLGPILFIGVVVPHFCRMLWNPAQLWHQWILNIILGIFIMQIFSIISEMSQFPINIITTFFGIPVILLMLVKKK